MNVVKRGKKRQLSPRSGVLRQAVAHAVERYSDARVREFEQGNRNTTAENAQVTKALKRRQPQT